MVAGAGLIDKDHSSKISFAEFSSAVVRPYACGCGNPR